MSEFYEDIQAARDRITAMFEAVISDLQVYPDPQQSYPYSNLYVNYALSQLPAPQTRVLGADKFRHTAAFRVRLTAGASTDGYEGTLALTVQYEYIPKILAYFYARRNLKYAAGQAGISHYNPEEFQMASSGLITWSNDEDGAAPFMGADFTITLAFEYNYRLEVG
jgi:hypothetical protein